MAMDLAGPPFHFTPDYSLALTIPQFLFCWLRAGDMVADAKLEDFHLRTYAIGAAMSKNGKNIIKRVSNALGGNNLTEEQVMEDLTETQQKVLFGPRRKRKS
jgi:hypothetical protein